MSPEFDGDLQRCRDGLDTAREELLASVRPLRDGDLHTGRRGHWDIRRVLEHVIWHEQIYVRMVAHLRGRPGPGDMPDNTPTSASDALEKLSASREALLASIEGIDEETFYKLGKMGYEEYSVLSMLENEANHEREHAAQIAALLAG